MRASTFVMVGFAVLFGVLAVFIANVWLNNHNHEQARSMQAEKPVAMRTIVVAAKPLRFGTELNASMLRETPWPIASLPSGTFAKINDLMSNGRRVVLTSIEPNEPVLALKITGPGQRATLSSLVKPGMKAATIRVNDVEGVGGFVAPGDRVDVVLTRQIDRSNASTEIVLQNARVLAVNQTADDRAVKPTLAKSVTLEVNALNAQKLSLASSVGKLSLLLRKAGESAEIKTRKITLKDLAGFANGESTTTVVVTRVTTKQSYTVPIEGSNGEEKATVGLSQAW